MDKIAQQLSEWFGSTPFILFHAIWFGIWYPLGGKTETLTLIVSLEAIFLALFILRAENVADKHIEHYIKETRLASKKDLKQTEEVKRMLKFMLGKFK